MNLIEILRARVDALPEGDHLAGLKSVLQHIVVAFQHHQRGTSNADDAAFTDAIYRCNQAFEGSLKEAYRVLASKDPMKVRPHDIETFFEEEKVLRPRVLAQFSNYRTDWRNPSTHDYRLNFDEDEALLAIVSVSAFAVVLCDQVAEKLSFNAAQAAVSASDIVVPDPAEPLLDVLARSLERFHMPASADRNPEELREVEVVGAIAGHLESSVPGLEVFRDPMFVSRDEFVRPDLLARLESAEVVIEVKRARGGWINVMRMQFLEQAAAYIQFSGASGALVYVYADGTEASNLREDVHLDSKGTRVVLLGPRSQGGSANER